MTKEEVDQKKRQEELRGSLIEVTLKLEEMAETACKLLVQCKNSAQYIRKNPLVQPFSTRDYDAAPFQDQVRLSQFGPVGESRASLDESYDYKYRVAHITGFQAMQITALKKNISEECQFDKELIANVGFTNDETLEIVLATSCINTFIETFTGRANFSIVNSTNLILADRNGIIERLKRVESDKVRNKDLKNLYRHIKEVLTTSNDKDIKEKVEHFTIDQFHTS